MGTSLRALVPGLIGLGVVFLFFLVLPGLSDRGADRVEFLARSQFALRAAGQVAGLVVAFAALLVLFDQALRGGPAGNLLLPAMCVLGGVLLFEPHWAIAVTFGLLAVTQVAERLIAARRATPPDPRPPAGDRTPD